MRKGRVKIVFHNLFSMEFGVSLIDFSILHTRRAGFQFYSLINILSTCRILIMFLQNCRTFALIEAFQLRQTTNEGDKFSSFFFFNFIKCTYYQMTNPFSTKISSQREAIVLCLLAIFVVKMRQKIVHWLQYFTWCVDSLRSYLFIIFNEIKNSRNNQLSISGFLRNEK